ncbi:dolichyl-phosphate beta-glucosyltransferase [Chlamydiota bacterium]
MEISIIIPAYNEFSIICDTIGTIETYLEDKFLLYEIIVVDDGSTDGTASRVESTFSDKKNIRLLKNDVNRGKGAAVRKGALASIGDLVLFSDADLSTPITELDAFLLLINEFSIVVGSRALPDSLILIHQPFYREYMGRVFNRFVQWIVSRGIKDTQCGFKLFRGDVARLLFSLCKIDGFCFDVEVLYLAHKKQYSIKEKSVIWRNDPTTKVHVFKDSCKMFLDLIRIKWLHRNDN